MQRPFAPLLVPAMAMAAGAYGGSRAVLHEEAAIASCLAAVGGLLALLLHLGRSPRRALVAVSLALASLSFAGAEREMARLSIRAAPWIGDDPVAVAGVLDQDPAWSPDSIVLTLTGARVMGQLLDVRVRLVVPRSPGDAALRTLGYGDAITTRARFTIPSGERNPGGFDWQRHLASRGIGASGSVKSALLIERSGHAPAHVVSDLCHRARRLCLARIARLFPGPAGSLSPDGALLAAFLLGDRGSLSDDDEQAFLVGGTYHVLAISGLHVALLGWLCHRALTLLRVPSFRLRWVLTGAVIVLYAIATEAPPSVARAATMGVLLVGSKVLGERVAAIQQVALSAVLVLLVHPLDIVDAGFQLTYLATFAIVSLASQPLGQALSWLPRVARDAIAVSLAAQIMTLPLIHATFYRLTPGSLLLNLTAVPLSGIALGSGMLGFLVPGLPGDLALSAAAIVLRVVAWSSGLLAHAPVLSYRATAPHWLLCWGTTLVAVLLSALAAPTLYLRRRPSTVLVGSVARRAIGALLGILVLVHHVAGARQARTGRLLVAALDVGQGDAILIRLPQGGGILVDGGGIAGSSFDVGRNVVEPALLALGVRRLDVVVLTHAHPDHGGGLPSIVRDLAVGQLWEGVAPGTEHAGFYAALHAASKDGGVAFREVRSGEHVVRDGVTIDVVWPPASARDRGVVRNDDSVVLLAAFGRHRFLLAGDVESPAERALAPGLPRCDVLKVAHHGSATSTSHDLLDVIRPRVALISVGAANIWGFPAKAVLERLTRTAVHRTDLEGAILVSSDGQRLEVTSHLGGPAGRFPPAREPVPDRRPGTNF